MICLFCKNDSSGSRSVEHVIPESLGNTTLTLPRGTVCDKCNNYFARKIEKPLLESLDVSALRFHQMIPSKKGRIPPLSGTVGPDAHIAIQSFTDGPFVGTASASPEAVELLFRHGANVINLPGSSDSWEMELTSRFLAKVALECLATRWIKVGDITQLAMSTSVEAIRTYARRGGRSLWPYHSRRIYDADTCWVMPDGEEVQRVWEFELLPTATGDCYFVVALFGLELTINLLEPEVGGYLSWLDRHDHVSPLYFGKNANDPNNGVPLMAESPPVGRRPRGPMLILSTEEAQ